MFDWAPLAGPFPVRRNRRRDDYDWEVGDRGLLVVRFPDGDAGEGTVVASVEAEFRGWLCGNPVFWLFVDWEASNNANGLQMEASFLGQSLPVSTGYFMTAGGLKDRMGLDGGAVGFHALCALSAPGTALDFVLD